MKNRSCFWVIKQCVANISEAWKYWTKGIFQNKKSSTFKQNYFIEHNGQNQVSPCNICLGAGIAFNTTISYKQITTACLDCTLNYKWISIVVFLQLTPTLALSAILFITVPIRPVRNVVFVRRPRTVSISFDSPAVVTGVFKYYVEYFITSAGSASAANATLSTSSGTFSSLQPFTNYTFVVSAAQQYNVV